MRAQGLGRLVHREPRPVGGDLEQRPARLAKIDRVEVLAIDLRRGVEAVGRQHVAQRHLVVVVGGPEGDVMDRTHPLPLRRQRRVHTDIDERPGRPAVTGPKAHAVVGGGDPPETESLLEHHRGTVERVRPHADAVKPAHGVFGRYRGRRPAFDVGGRRRADELQGDAVRIVERQHLLIETGRTLERHVVFGQALGPEGERVRGHCQADLHRGTGAVAPGRGPREGKERQRRPGRADGVAVVQMISARIVEIDGLLDEAHAEHTRVESHVLGRIAADRGDMVQASAGFGHASSPQGPRRPGDGARRHGVDDRAYATGGARARKASAFGNLVRIV